MSAEHGDAARSGLQILVVDDDDDVRDVAVRQLTSLGYRTLAAANGVDALSLLDRTPDIDLLFVDFSMPGMDGAEVAERARRVRPTLKVLFASGNFDVAAGESVHLIIKPYRKKDLAEKLREVLGQSGP